MTTWTIVSNTSEGYFETEDNIYVLARCTSSSYNNMDYTINGN